MGGWQDEVSKQKPELSKMLQVQDDRLNTVKISTKITVKAHSSRTRMGIRVNGLFKMKSN